MNSKQDKEIIGLAIVCILMAIIYHSRDWDGNREENKQMKYKAGDIVKIKEFDERPSHWNCAGRMDKYMGEVVVINNVVDGDQYPYQVYDEDRCWYFLESDFDGLVCNYAIGDRVKIKNFDNHTLPYYWNPRMKELIGNEVEIIEIEKYDEITSYRVRLCIDRYSYGWWVYESDFEYKVNDEVKDVMTKDDLKTGMVVERRDGYRLLVLKELDMCISRDSGYMSISNCNDDLSSSVSKHCDIQRVFKPYLEGGFECALKGCNNSNLIWEREEPKEMTIEEVEQELGYQVKIVEEKEV